jgi:hypothetical protein
MRTKPISRNALAQGHPKSQLPYRSKSAQQNKGGPTENVGQPQIVSVPSRLKGVGKVSGN